MPSKNEWYPNIWLKCICRKELLNRYSDDGGHLDFCVRVKEGQEGDDGEGKEDLGEVQCKNPSGHMLHPADWMVSIGQIYFLLRLH